MTTADGLCHSKEHIICERELWQPGNRMEKNGFTENNLFNFSGSICLQYYADRTPKIKQVERFLKSYIDVFCSLNESGENKTLAEDAQ